MLGLAAAQMAVASAALFAKQALNCGLSPVALAAWRLGIAAVLVVGVEAVRKRLPNAAPTARATRPMRALLCAAGLLLALHFAFWFASLRTVPVAVSTMLVCTGPLFAAAAERLFKRRRAEPRFYLSLVVAFGGVALLLQPAFTGNALNLAGCAMAVCGAAAIAGYLLLAESARDNLPSGTVVAYTYSAAAFALLVLTVTLPHSGDAVPHSRAALVNIAMLALLPQLAGHTLMNWALRYFSASTVSTSTLLEPALAAGLAWWFLHQQLAPVQIVGMAVTVVGVAYAVRQKPSQPPAQQPVG